MKKVLKISLCLSLFLISYAGNAFRSFDKSKMKKLYSCTVESHKSWTDGSENDNNNSSNGAEINIFLNEYDNIIVASKDDNRKFFGLGWWLKKKNIYSNNGLFFGALRISRVVQLEVNSIKIYPTTGKGKIFFIHNTLSDVMQLKTYRSKYYLKDCIKTAN